MNTEPDFGRVTGHLVGIAMKEMVRRAISIIRAERFIFEAHDKKPYGINIVDFVTSADRKAQHVYVRLIRESFPEYGIIAEEDSLRHQCRFNNRSMYFTVDPLDGTKAFMRRQSHGIGTMISLLGDDDILAAYVGDVMTQEVYGYRPGPSIVYRISEFGRAERLSINRSRPLTDQFVLFMDELHMVSPFAQGLVGSYGDKQLFKGYEIMRGSIGLATARLWKGEVGGVVLPRYHETPWDMCPVIGISKTTGFVFLRIEGDTINPYEPAIPREITMRNHETLIVHGSRIEELSSYVLELRR